MALKAVGIHLKQDLKTNLLVVPKLTSKVGSMFDYKHITSPVNLSDPGDHAHPLHKSQITTLWRASTQIRAPACHGTVNRFIYFLALEIWTPRFLCTPEHSMQSKIPKFKDAQSGSTVPQSAQTAFPGTRRRISNGFSCGSWASWALRLRPDA